MYNRGHLSESHWWMTTSDGLLYLIYLSNLYVLVNDAEGSFYS